MNVHDRSDGEPGRQWTEKCGRPPDDPDALAQILVRPYDHDDELLAAVRADGRARLRVYRLPQAMVVLGRGSEVRLEVEIRACLDDGVPLLRRRGGGCSVVVDPGNVVVALVLPVCGIGGSPEHFAVITAWLISALEGLGFSGVHREGVSDLVLAGRKVGGACLHRSRGLLYYGCTLLAAPLVELITRYLRHPPREPAYRQGRAHADFVGRLLPPGGRPAAGAEALAEALRRRLRLEELSAD